MHLHDAHRGEPLATRAAAQADDQVRQCLADQPVRVRRLWQRSHGRSQGRVDLVTAPHPSTGGVGNGLQLRRLEHGELAEYAVGHQRLVTVGRVAKGPDDRVCRIEPRQVGQVSGFRAGAHEREEVEIGVNVDAPALASSGAQCQQGHGVIALRQRRGDGVQAREKTLARTIRCQIERFTHGLDPHNRPIVRGPMPMRRALAIRFDGARQNRRRPLPRHRSNR